jgi:shikimate dehydrogenase
MITGTTKLFPIIGFPVAGVFSPPAFNARFEKQSLDVVMVAMDVAPGGLDAFWSLLRNSTNMIGCSVTYPHKQAAFQTVDGMTDRAARLGALNTLRKNSDGSLTGEATDGLAMMSAISKTSAQITGKTAHVLGAGGGAGTAIVDALCHAGIGRLVIGETDEQRHLALRHLLSQHWPDVEVTEKSGPADILVNATTLGKRASDPLPFSVSAIKSASLCCDVVTASEDTAFALAARHAGVLLADGNAMGEGQLDVQLGFLGLDGDQPADMNDATN